MKKTACTLMLLASLTVSGVVSADDTAVQSRVDQIKSEFNLNDQQAKRIANILSSAGMNKEEKRAARMDKRLERRVKRMTRQLDLSDDQATQLKAILTQQSDAMHDMRTQAKADITAILTPEQAAKFTEMSDGRKGKGRKGRHGKKHGKRGGHGSKCEAQ